MALQENLEEKKLENINQTEEAVLRYICENKSLPFEVNKIIKFSERKNLKNVNHVQSAELIKLLIQSIVNSHKGKYKELNVVGKEKFDDKIDYDNNNKVLKEYLNFLKEHKTCPVEFKNFSNDKIATSIFNLHLFVVKKWLHAAITNKHPIEHLEGSDDDSLNTLIQQLLNDLTPILNEILPNLIKQLGYDPYQNVWNKSGNVGGSAFGASYSVNLSNITGLSGLTVDSFSNLSVTGSVNSFQGSTTLSAHLSNDLNISLDGSATATIFWVPVTVSISGNATCSNVSASSNATISGGFSLNPLKATLDTLTLSNLDINVGSVDVDISGLGPLDPILDALIDAIVYFIKDIIANAIASVVQNALNDAIQSKLPIST